MAYTLEKFDILKQNHDGTAFCYYRETDVVVATIVASGYFDGMAKVLASGSLIFIVGSDACGMYLVTNTSDVITVENAQSVLNPTQVGYLEGVTPGTQAASKAVIANSDVNTGISKITELHIGATGSETQVTATPAELNILDGVTSNYTELNFLDGATAGTQFANKAVIADGNINIGIAKITELHIGSTGTETQVTSTAAELNILDGVTANKDEINFVDGATAGTQIANKAVIANADVNTGVSKVTELHIGPTGSETQVTSTAAELNILDGVTADKDEINYLNEVTAGTQKASKAIITDSNINSGISKITELHIGATGSETQVTSTAAELNILDGATATYDEINFLDGATAGTQVASKAVISDANVNTGVSKITELHIGATGSETQVTSTAAELNILDGVTSDKDEINFLDGATAGTQVASKAVIADANVNTGVSKITALHIGATGSETEVTSSADELNILDGATANKDEINFLDGATAGTQVASKAVIADANVNTGVSKITALHIGATGSETQVTSTAAELNILDGVTADKDEINFLDGATAGTQVASKAVIADANVNTGVSKVTELHIGATGSETQVNATAAELNKKCDDSAMLQIITVAGAQVITAGKQAVYLNNAANTIAATIATAVAHQGLFLVKAGTEPAGGQDHTCVLTIGTWNGTNATATFADIDDFLLVYFDATGAGTILVNNGAVALS